jgi:hypothetical protein
VTRKSKSKRFGTVDAETDPFRVGRVPQPFIWGLYFGDTEEYHEFKTVDELLAFVEDMDIVLYAHNGGKFDYHYFKDRINSDENIMVISGRLARFKVGACEFRDSINLLVNPLRAFCKDDIDYAKMEPDVRHLHMDEIRRYLKSDCVNLYNTVASFFARYGRTLTQAGASMRYWKKHFPVQMVPQTMLQSELYRDYYYGGRVQCFVSGHGRRPFKVADRNSAYPHAMREKHPFSPEAIVQEHLPPAGKIGPCMIRLEATAKGCFPLRGEDGSLYFPEDERQIREYFVTGWELLTALEYNACKVFRIKEVHRFSQTLDFCGYVDHFYNERVIAKANGDRAGDNFAKIFMNGLYGKFAADPEKYHEYLIASCDTVAHWCAHTTVREDCGLCDRHGPVSDSYQPVRAWGQRHLVARRLPEDKHRYYNVATAGSITGYVRAGLFAGLMKCSGVLYCDTDSITAQDVTALPQGGELGQWKIEMEGDEYAIAGKKTYAKRKSEAWYAREVEAARRKDPGKDPYKSVDRWKVACKGVDLTAEEIVRAANGETVLYDPEVPTYSIHRDLPIFISREVRNTFRDIRHVPATPHFAHA